MRFSPPDCRYVESIDIPNPLHAKEIVFPLIYSASIIGPEFDGTAILVDHLIEVIAHETAHVIQLYPFTQDRAERMVRDPVLVSRGHPMGLTGEFEATLVDHCIKQPIVPDGPRRRDDMQSLVQALSEGRQRPNISPDAASEQIHVSAMQVVTSVLGANWLDPDDASLRKLFPHCVMALDGRLTPGQAGTPTEEDVRRGEAALQAIRHVVAEPIRFPGAFH